MSWINETKTNGLGLAMKVMRELIVEISLETNYLPILNSTEAWLITVNFNHGTKTAKMAEQLVTTPEQSVQTLP